MPAGQLTDDNILQSNSGGFNAASGNATLAATTAGTTVVLVAFTYGTTISTPTGFVQDSPSVGANSQALYVFRKSNVAAGETSWGLTLGVAAPCSWVAYEIDGLDLSAPLAAGSPYTTATAQSLNTGSTQFQSSYDAIYLAAHGAYDAGSATPPTWTGHTDSFTELHDQGAAGASTSVGLSVSRRFVQSIGQYSCTATSSLAANGPLAAVVVAYASSWSKKTSDISFHAGFEWGTDAGLATGGGALGSKLFANSSGTPTVVTTTPRSGSYCLELSASAASEWLSWNVAANAAVLRLPFHFPGSLPAGDVQLGAIITGVATAMIWYRTSSQKVGVQIGANATVLSDVTVAADTWHAIDISLEVATGAYNVQWQLNGVDQTPTSSATSPGSAITTVRIGWLTAATATVRYDDIIVSTILSNYPLGDHKVVLVPVDPAGTVTVNGATANFKTFTANGTLAAWDATAARNAIDERPPTIGGTADGIAIVTASTAYVEVPMDTYTAAADEAIRAVRIIACGWAASDPAAATILLTGWDGTTATALGIEQDPGFTNSTTTPGWLAKMFNPSGGWTQTKLDALAVRLSTLDATPDIGIHALYAEVAIALADNEVLFGEPGGLYVEAKRDPITNGLLGFVVTTPASTGATVNYEVNGVAYTTGYIAPSSTLTVNLQAPDFPTINLITLVPG